MPDIATIFGITPPTPVRDSKAAPLLSPDPSLMYGLELEIEGISGNPENLYVSGMRGERDNSLRENAHGIPWEFITKPATYSVLVSMLERFFTKANLTMEKNYSERCSVHVHANVLDFLPTQLKGLCLLYQVFERLFYAYAGNDRDKNIFCVPWSQTALTYKMIDNLTPDGIGGLRGWQKYTGMNLIPVTSQGTVEFRHLPGTPDLKRIMDWVSMIGCLFAYARNTDVSLIQNRIIEVNTTSAYAGILSDVFGRWAPLFDSPARDALLEEGVIDVKYMLLSSQAPKEKATVTTAWDDLQRAVERDRARLNAQRAATYNPAARVITPGALLAGEIRWAELEMPDWNMPLQEAINPVPVGAAALAAAQAPQPAAAHAQPLLPRGGLIRPRR